MNAVVSVRNRIGYDGRLNAALRNVRGLRSLLLGCLVAVLTAMPSIAQDAARDSRAESGNLQELVQLRPWQSDAGYSGLADADVIRVQARESGTSWSFTVTVRHADTGWSDYADGWDVLLPDGTVLGPVENDGFTRLLLHPHVNEQPFTRSRRGVSVPDGARYVVVRAHDIVHGFGGLERVIDLTSPNEHQVEVAYDGL